MRPEISSKGDGVDPSATVHKKSQCHLSDVSESGDSGGQPPEGRPKEGQDPEDEEVQLDETPDAVEEQTQHAGFSLEPTRRNF